MYCKSSQIDWQQGWSRPDYSEAAIAAFGYLIAGLIFGSVVAGFFGGVA